jgi:D-alanyl-D-alanine carboxypeptidase
VLRSIRFGVVMTAFALALGSDQDGLAQRNSTSSENPLKEALRKDLRDYLNSRSTIEHISTLSMTVSFRGGSTINAAVGTTEYGGGKPVTPNNVFQIGSNTKAFTSVLLLRLEADGVLSIDDTVGKWLPQYPAWSDITIRQLLNMTSRIPTYDNEPAQISEYDNDPYVENTLSQLVAFVYPTVRTSGPGFGYSNTGYILVQMIIDKAYASMDHHGDVQRDDRSNKEDEGNGDKDYYKKELRKLIDEVGLRDTFYEPYFYPESVTRRLVSGYYVNTDPPVLTKLLGKDTSGFSLGWTQAAGGMISTPEDLTKWARALFEGNVLQPKQLSELTSLVAIPSGEPIPETSPANPQGFALGLFQLDDPDMGMFWGYQGSTIGYRAAYAYFPSTGLIICVFTNSQVASDESTVTTVLFHSLYDTLKANGKI